MRFEVWLTASVGNQCVGSYDETQWG